MKICDFNIDYKYISYNKKFDLLEFHNVKFTGKLINFLNTDSYYINDTIIKCFFDKDFEKILKLQAFILKLLIIMIIGLRIVYKINF